MMLVQTALNIIKMQMASRRRGKKEKKNEDRRGKQKNSLCCYHCCYCGGCTCLMSPIYFPFKEFLYRNRFVHYLLYINC